MSPAARKIFRRSVDIMEARIDDPYRTPSDITMNRFILTADTYHYLTGGYVNRLYHYVNPTVADLHLPRPTV